MQHPSICPYAYGVLIPLFTIINFTVIIVVFIFLLLLLFYCCHQITVTTDKLLREKSFSGVVELTTQLLRLINILWLPLCWINKFGIYFPRRLLRSPILVGYQSATVVCSSSTRASSRGRHKLRSVASPAMVRSIPLDLCASFSSVDESMDLNCLSNSLLDSSIAASRFSLSYFWFRVSMIDSRSTNWWKRREVGGGLWKSMVAPMCCFGN